MCACVLDSGVSSSGIGTFPVRTGIVTNFLLVVVLGRAGFLGQRKAEFESNLNVKTLDHLIV